MPGNWTPPRTWVDGETPGGSTFNTHVRDNLGYLKDSPTFDGNVNVTGTLSIAAVTATTVTANGDLTATGTTRLATCYVSVGLAVGGGVTLGDAPEDPIICNGTMTGARLQNYSETHTSVAAPGGVVTLDCNAGTYFSLGLAAQNHTVSIVNVPALNRAVGITLLTLNTVGAGPGLTWPGSVKWPGGLAPTPTQAYGKWDVYSLVTYDAGANWFGIVVGQNY